MNTQEFTVCSRQYSRTAQYDFTEIEGPLIQLVAQGFILIYL
jgi:hypothetical protein